MVEMLVGYGFKFFGLSLLVGGWREVYRASQEARLATDRLYLARASRLCSERVSPARLCAPALHRL